MNIINLCEDFLRSNDVKSTNLKQHADGLIVITGAPLIIPLRLYLLLVPSLKYFISILLSVSIK